MARRDVRFALKSQLATAGVNDHGGLTGLADDDHTQYFNVARGDAQYYTQTAIDARVLNDILDVAVGAPGPSEDGYVLQWDDAASEFNLVVLTPGLTSVAVSDLDNGTDGELITWSAAGVATTVAVGTATEVLTSNGVGVAPTFQAAGGGSALVNFVDNGIVGEMNYNSGIAARTALLGLDIADPNSTGITAIQFFDNAFAAQQGVILTNHSSTGIRVRSNIHGATLVLDGENAVGTVATMLIGDPDGNTDIYADGALSLSAKTSGIQVENNSGAGNTVLEIKGNTTTNPSINFEVDTNTKFQLQYKNDGTDIANFRLVDTGDIFTFSNDTDGLLLVLNGAGAVELYDAGTHVAGTWSQGLAAFHASPTLRLFNAAGSTALGQLAISGLDLYFDNNQTGGDMIWRVSNAGVTDTIALRYDESETRLEFYHDNVQVGSTGPQGIWAQHASPYFRMYNAAGTTLLGQYTVSGNDLYNDNNVVGGDLIFRVSASSSVDTVAMTYDESETRMELNFAGTLAAATHAAGMNVYDTSGNDPFIGFWDDTSTRMGYLQFSDQAAGSILRNEDHGGKIQFQQEDSVGTVQTGMQIGASGTAAEIGFYATAPIVLQTGVAVTAAGVHAALVNLGLITA
jgi:hypothetical protein